MDRLTFESRLALAIIVCAVVLVACLVSLALDRFRRRSSPFRAPAFREAHVQPTQRASPTVATLVSSRREVTIAERPRRSANPTREWERQTNHGTY